MDRLFLDERLGIQRLCSRLALERDLRGDGHGLDAEVDDLDRPAVVPVGIEALVPAVEALEESLLGGPRFPIGDVDLVGLAEIAAVERTFEDDVRAAKPSSAMSRRLLFEGPEFGLEPGQADLGIRSHEGLGVVLDRIRHEQAEGRKDAGVARHDDRGHAQVGGHLDGVHAARSAEREKGEGARIDAALDGDDADGLLHVGVGDGDDAEGRLDRRLPDRASQPRDGRRASFRMDLHFAAQEEIRVQAAEAEVGVGHGRDSSPLP